MAQTVALGKVLFFSFTLQTLFGVCWFITPMHNSLDKHFVSFLYTHQIDDYKDDWLELRLTIQHSIGDENNVMYAERVKRFVYLDADKMCCPSHIINLGEWVCEWSSIVKHSLKQCRAHHISNGATEARVLSNSVEEDVTETWILKAQKANIYK